MSLERWRQIEDLFARALECPFAERQAFLNQACQGDQDLRRELESLLECDAPDQRLLEVPTVLDPDRQSEAEMVGRRIGFYRVIRLIGRGGMGAVYLGGRDDDQYRKQVAIKLLKRGMDTDFMLTRFHQERQILANLEHPFIARLIDGGATDDGLPYFVMEYVDGVPITTYCADRNLSIPERLRLFGMICEAVQHAHQNLVIHRDIKPGNILATKEGIPKLLDFGIAKVIDPETPVGITLTQREQRMLTPDYASPEQIRGLPVSTASDIYSLGAVLYELLTDLRPHRFTSSSLAALEHEICVAEPLRPSIAVAENESLPPAVRKYLRRQLSGDLDNIVLAALQKEPQRRYASAAEFAEDLRRHAEGLPVLAHEDHWPYRAGKFVRRHRWVIGTAALVAASLIAGIVATTIQARRAEQRFQIVRGLARTMLFDLYNEMERLPGSISLRAATIRTVVNYLDTLAQSGSHDPELDLEIATAYERVALIEGHPFASNLGHGIEALSNYRKALAIFERLASRSGYRSQAIRGLIDSHVKLAGLESLFGNPEASNHHSRKAAEIATKAFALDTSEVPLSTQINVYFRLADLAYDRGAADEELANYLKALDLATTWLAREGSAAAADHLVECYRAVGSAKARRGDLFGALESYRSAQRAAEDLARRLDVKPDHRFGIISILLATGEFWGRPTIPISTTTPAHWRTIRRLSRLLNGFPSQTPMM